MCHSIMVVYKQQDICEVTFTSKPSRHLPTQTKREGKRHAPMMLCPHYSTEMRLKCRPCIIGEKSDILLAGGGLGFIPAKAVEKNLSFHQGAGRCSLQFPAQSNWNITCTTLCTDTLKHTGHFVWLKGWK